MDWDAMVARLRRWNGLQPCCGATNRHCDTPARGVVDTPTGCETCGHPRGCHA